MILSGLRTSLPASLIGGLSGSDTGEPVIESWFVVFADLSIRAECFPTNALKEAIASKLYTGSSQTSTIQVRATWEASRNLYPKIRYEYENMEFISPLFYASKV